MHASHKKKKNSLNFNPFFKISKSALENTSQFLSLEKSNLYLMKIQISVGFRKIRSVFNENTDQFCV